MSETEPVRVELSTDDAERLRRLSEEVQGRLEEIALIASRVLGRPLDGDVIRKFVPQALSADFEAGLHIEILEPHGDTPGCCMVFCHGRGTRMSWLECPCGVGGPCP